MEPGLAARHPEITTYAGRGIDDPAATIRADQTPLGFHASVRSPAGAWYVDPYYHLDDSVYITYFGRDLGHDPHGGFVEQELDEDTDPLALQAVPQGPEVQLRTYRLALVTDPGYATFFGGPQNVTAAKVTLMNRVNQIYEDETAIRLVLIDGNDELNLDTQAELMGADGPCGAAPCYVTPPTCNGANLQRTRIVIGQLVGASNYDIGHLALGTPGGGVANVGVARQHQGPGVHRPVDAGRRLLRRRLRGARDGPPVRRQPHLQRHGGQLLRRQPQRDQLGRARQRHVDHGLRRDLRAGQPAAAQRPVLVAAQLRSDHGLRDLQPAADQRGPDRLAARLRRRRRVAPAAVRRRRVAADRARLELHGPGHRRRRQRQRGADRRDRARARSRSAISAPRPCRSCRA